MLFTIVATIPDIRSLEPKPNKLFNEVIEKDRIGFHFEKYGNKNSIQKDATRDCPNKAHTPKPLYAITNPQIPPINVAMKLILANDLKSILAINFARCTILNEPNTKLMDKALRILHNNGSL